MLTLSSLSWVGKLQAVYFPARKEEVESTEKHLFGVVFDEGS